MATIKKCDRCNRIKPGPYYYVRVVFEIQEDVSDDKHVVEIVDCCAKCRATIEQRVTLKKRKRKPKTGKKTGSNAAQRKKKKTAQKVSGKKAETFDTAQPMLADLPTPSGQPAKPVIPQPPQEVF